MFKKSHFYLFFLLLLFSCSFNAQKEESAIGLLFTDSELRGIKSLKRILQTTGVNAGIRLKKGIKNEGLDTAYYMYSLEVYDTQLNNESMEKFTKDLAPMLCLSFYGELSKQEKEKYAVVRTVVSKDKISFQNGYTKSQLETVMQCMKASMDFSEGLLQGQGDAQKIVDACQIGLYSINDASNLIKEIQGAGKEWGEVEKKTLSSFEFYTNDQGIPRLQMTYYVKRKKVKQLQQLDFLMDIETYKVVGADL